VNQRHVIISHLMPIVLVRGTTIRIHRNGSDSHGDALFLVPTYSTLPCVQLPSSYTKMLRTWLLAFLVAAISGVSATLVFLNESLSQVK
ncbi:hypothetical protein JOM56_004187, partial [Amanita muscaria]